MEQQKKEKKQKAYLLLENGTVFEGQAFGAIGEITGEIVFTTGMGSYLETLTDPNFYGQIICQTFPLIGNYGTIEADFERDTISAKGYIVKHLCENPSNFRCQYGLDEFLKKQNIVGICGIDTRMLTKIIRDAGVMNGKIITKPPTDADKKEAKSYVLANAVPSVSKLGISDIPSVVEPLALKMEQKHIDNPVNYRIALLDFGSKAGLANALIARGCSIKSFGVDVKLEDILAYNPDGIMLSNGPGDPSEKCNLPIVELIKKLFETNIPMFGVCLGHQLMALAKGYKIKKMKFGHRGGQSVKEVTTGKLYLTNQNHGYTVVTDKSSFINVNDSTCEGLDYGVSFSVQFQPARGGSLDTTYLFDRFLDRISIHKEAKN